MSSEAINGDQRRKPLHISQFPIHGLETEEVDEIKNKVNCWKFLRASDYLQGFKHLDMETKEEWKSLPEYIG